jgi:hypothetical protein
MASRGRVPGSTEAERRDAVEKEIPIPPRQVDNLPPSGLLFYSDPTPEGPADNTLCSILAADSASYPVRSDVQGGHYYLADLPEQMEDGRKPLADVFLAVIPVCSVGTWGETADDPLDSDHLPSQLIQQGADITISPRGCIVFGPLGLSWESYFWACARDGDRVGAGIDHCSLEAGLYAEQVNPQVTDLAHLYCIKNFRVRRAPGIMWNERLVPARYGDSSN